MKKLILIGLILFFAAATLRAEKQDSITDCTLYDLAENEIHLSDFRGKSIILWFWASWCPICIREIPKLNNLYRELKISGIKLLAINVNEGKEKIIRVLKYYPMNFPVLQDKDGFCAYFYGVLGFPTYILIDTKGRVKFKQHYFPRENYRELLIK